MSKLTNPTIVQCACGQKSRMPDDVPPGKIARCAVCKTELDLNDAIDVDDESDDDEEDF